MAFPASVSLQSGGEERLDLLLGRRALLLPRGRTVLTLHSNFDLKLARREEACASHRHSETRVVPPPLLTLRNILPLWVSLTRRT